jgi:hypothetical protein
MLSKTLDAIKLLFLIDFWDYTQPSVTVNRTAARRPGKLCNARKVGAIASESVWLGACSMSSGRNLDFKER